MELRYVIRHRVLVDGKSQRETARELGVSRKTVSKYLADPDPERVTHSRNSPVTEQIAPLIEDLLEQWEGRTTKKQRITGTLVHQTLLEAGHNVGITTVRKYLKKRAQGVGAKTVLPLVWEPGEAAQVDFFEVTVDIAGQRQKAMMFLMRLMYSKRDFAVLYPTCDQIAFLDGHVRALEHFGAVPNRIIYDNLSPAVKRILKGQKRELTGRFLALVTHYLFEPSFARPGVGADKGGVEARGKGVRLQHLTPIPRGETLEEVNGMLMARITKREQTDTTLERFKQELPLMLELCERPFDARKVEVVSVYGNSKVRCQNAWYSVPSSWAHPEVTAYISPHEVELVCGDRSVTHSRVRAGSCSIKYKHYLPDLATKPQAVRQVITKLLPELEAPFGQLWRLLVDSHGPGEAARVFSKVLGAVVDHGESAVAHAISTAEDLRGLAKLGVVEQRPEVRVPEVLREFQIEAPDLAAFAHLSLVTEVGNA